MLSVSQSFPGFSGRLGHITPCIFRLGLCISGFVCQSNSSFRSPPPCIAFCIPVGPHIQGMVVQKCAPEARMCLNYYKYKRFCCSTVFKSCARQGGKHGIQVPIRGNLGLSILRGGPRRPLQVRFCSRGLRPHAAFSVCVSVAST